MAEEGKVVVRRYYELLDKGDMDGIMNLFSDDVKWNFAGMGTMDKQALKGLIQGFRGAFPNLQHVLDSQTAEGDWVTTPLTFRGTQTGEMMGIPPSNKAVEIRGINIHRVVNGKIVEAETAMDMMELMKQIGALPSS